MNTLSKTCPANQYIQYDLISSPILIFNKEEKIIYWNNAVQNLGCSAASESTREKGTRVSDLFPEAFSFSLLQLLRENFCAEAKFDAVTLKAGNREIFLDKIVFKREIHGSETLGLLQLFTGTVTETLTPGNDDHIIKLSGREAQGKKELKIRLDMDSDDIIPGFTRGAIVAGDELEKLIQKEDAVAVFDHLQLANVLQHRQGGILRLSHIPGRFFRYEILPVGNKKTVLLRLFTIESDSHPVGQERSALDFCSVFEDFNCGIFLSDENGKYLYSNPWWQKLSGYESGDQNGCWMDSIHEEDRLWAMNIWHLAYRNKLVFDYELRLKESISRPARWIFVNSFSFTCADGKYYFGGIVNDIQEKKKNEQELVLAKNDFESLFGLAQKAYLIVNDNRIICNCNKQFAELFGYDDPMELIGKNTRSLCPSTEYHEELADMFGASFHKQGTFSGLLQVKRKDNSVFHARIIATRLSGGSETSGSIAVSATDISAALEKELTARKNEIRLSELSKALDQSLLVSITDRNGVITYVNEAFSETFGYPVNEVIGKTHRVLNSGFHSRLFFRNLWNTILSGKTWKGVIKNKLQNGGYYWTDTTIIPQFDENGHISQFIALRYDITKFITDQYREYLRVEQDLIAAAAPPQESFLVEETMPEYGKTTKNNSAHVEKYTRLLMLFPHPVICLLSRPGESSYIITCLNDAAENIFSAEKSELIDKKTSDIKNVVLNSLLDMLNDKIGSDKDVQKFTNHFNTALWEAWFEIELVRISSEQFVIVMTDVTKWILNDNEITAKQKQMELMFREFRHRFKNNLQLLISLSSIHRNKQRAEETDTFLIEAENRAKIISVINDTLDWNKDLSDVRVDLYTKDLIRLLSQTYGHTGIEIEADIVSVSLSVTSALNYGIILNELLANCYKHAFRHNEKGSIQIKLVYENGKFVLSVTDNGLGIVSGPGRFSGSEGLVIIREIASHMRGEVVIEQKTRGLHVCVSFTDMKFQDHGNEK